MNRYAFAGGNPISFIELDGHWSLSDIGHAVLDVAGLVPVVGEVADVANGIWYAAEGDWVNAGLSLASAIPIAGYGATAAKYGLKYGDEALALARGGDNLPTGASRLAGDAPSPRVDAPAAKPDAPAPKPDASAPKPDTPAPTPAPKPAGPPPAPATPGGGTTRVFRVEGPGNARLNISQAGGVSIKGDGALFLNFGDEARARAFQQLRLAQGRRGTVIKSFEVPTSYVDALRASAVPERLARRFPDKPFVVDVSGIGTVEVVGACPGTAGTVLARCREVMAVVLDHQSGEWPEVDTWRRLLPDWFVAACVEESSEQTERWLAWWRTLPAEQQAAAEARQPWSLADWLFHLEPDERQWFWWDATTVGADQVVVDLEVAGWPVPLGSFGWLLRAAGADEVTVIENHGARA